MTTYVWQFDSLDVYPTYNSLTNVVQSIHWRMTADDGSGHTASAYGEEAAGSVDVDNFIPFGQLTTEIVSGWIEAILGEVGVSSLRSWLDGRIAEQANPPTASRSPPWL